jgi:hypothetical protein
MPGPLVQGTFATGQNPVSGNASDVIDVPSSNTAFSAPTMKLTTVGLDASNTIKTQKITAPGTAWADQTTYNSDQTATAITVVAGEQWRVVGVTQQALKDIRYKLSLES